MSEGDKPVVPHGYLQRAWAYLAEPSAVITKPGQRRQAWLLTTLLLCLLLSSLFMIPGLFEPGPPLSLHVNANSFLTIGSVVLLLVAYGISRTRYYILAAILTTWGSVGLTFWIAVPRDLSGSESLLHYLIIPVLLSSIFLPIYATIALVVVGMVGLWLFPSLAPSVAFENLPPLFFLLTSSLILLTSRYRSLLERDRQIRLMERETQLRLLTDRLPVSIWTTDAGLYVTNLLGARMPMVLDDEESYIGKTLYKIIDSADPNLSAVAMHLKAIQGESVRREMVFRDVHLDIRVDPLRNAAGNIVGCIGTALDITEHKQLERQIQDYADHLQKMVDERTEQLNRLIKRVNAILNSASDAIVLVYPGGTIEQTNPTFNRLFGYAVDELFDAPFTTLVKPGEHTEKLDRAMRKAVQNRQIGRLEIVARRKDGSTFDADVALAPVEVSKERAPSVAVSLRDITHLKELDRFKSRFIDNVAHDLGNPIANLKVRLYLLKKSPERLDEHLDVLEKQTQRLTHLVEDLRTLSAIDQNVQFFTFTPVDLNELVEEVIESHLSMAAAKEQTFTFKPGENLPAVRADRRQLERVIVNLVSNALKYTPQGGTITVATEQQGDMCSCSVRDNGIGIAPEDLPHIFERFYRSERVQKNGTEGTGLGLAIAQEIAEAHGGRIEVQSIFNEWSKFTVWLPLEVGNVEAPA